MEKKTTEIEFDNANKMPAITWHFLRMNHAVISVPDGLALSPSVKVDEPFLSRGATDEFENALNDAQVEWENTHPAPTAEELAKLEEAMAAEADATYGGTARSAYQVAADAVEEARSLSLSFESGTGDEASAYLRYAAGDRVVIKADKGQSVDAQVVVESVSGAFSVAAIDVIADAEATVNLSLVVASDEAALKQGASDEGDATSNGMTGTTLRVFADTNATVNVVRTQALADGVTDIDDMGLFAAGGATLNIRQTVLGSSMAYTGVATDLRGDESQITIDTHYLGHGTQQRDFNYIVRHHGEKSESNLVANGVLAGKSRKVLRGTIDFIRGCCGSEGSENETVLLVDEGVRNKTVPTLLCNEDDVAGNHGATIGHIREEQLFYLTSRGLSPEAAERMFATAMIEQALLDAPDVQTRDAVINLGKTIDSGFAALFDEEV